MFPILISTGNPKPETFLICDDASIHWQGVAGYIGCFIRA